MCDTSGSTSLSNYIDLTDLLSTNSVLVKHAIYKTDGRTDLFVSDLMGGNIFRVTDVYSTSPSTSIEIEVSTNNVVFSNGLEVYNDILLIGGFDGLSRYYITTKEGPTYIAGPNLTPGSPLINSEGIRFNGDKSILYWPKYLSDDSDPNEVLAVQSNDGWVSDVWIAMALQIDCVSSSPRDMSAAVAFSDTNPDNAYDEDLWVVCNNNNGNGPYLYPRVQNVNGVVTGLSRSEMAVNADTYASSSDDCDEEESIIYGLSALIVFLVVSTIVLAFLLCRVKKDEMRKTLNDKQDSAM
jgi:hypothetical protein